MGMFDSLKEKLKSFTKSASKEADIGAPAAAAAPPARQIETQKPAPAKTQPATFEVVKKEAAPKPEPARPVETVAAPAKPTSPPAPQPEASEAAAPAKLPTAVAPAGAAAPTAPQGAGGRQIKIERIEDLLFDLELSLLESDVALPVVEAIKANLKKNLGSVRVGSTDDIPKAVEDALRSAILDVLAMERIDFDTWLIEKLATKKPAVVMFVGVNGTGKTTAIGRLAHRLKENGYTSVVAAGDTFRAGAIEQLTKHAEKLGITIVKHQAGSDPAAVAFDAIEHAKSRLKDVVLLDTAGRMQTNTNLMDEMKKVKRVAQPDLIVFVGDSLAGNDAVEQAVKFNEAVGVDAVILTKVDTDAKGGAALSIAHAVGKPILFLGVGQEYGDLVPYDPRWMVNRIFEEAPSA